MLFDTPTYWVFFAAAWLALRVAPQGIRLHLLVALSYAFYAAWDWRFLGLLIASTVTDHVASHAIHRAEDERIRNRWFALSLIVNLGILATFKYAGFFVDSAKELLNSLGFATDGPTLEIVLPVGVSFYTFQTLSHTFDVWRRDTEPEPSPVTFAAFVAYFPQLVAGPIERSRDLLPQLRAFRPATAPSTMISGFTLFVVGLFKKVVVADQMAPIVAEAFDDPSSASSLTLGLGAVAFALQIYGDFSGYTDMARGASRLLGIELGRNFDRPYLSPSITQFWQRWHISLSSWLRDYLYRPLGGNRKGLRRTQINLLLTMLLGGLWHGANWTFVVWGGIHGLLLLIERAGNRGRTPASQVRRVLATLRTFVVVTIAWIFFRAGSLGEAADVVSGIFDASGGWPIRNHLYLVVLATVLVAIHDTLRPRGEEVSERPLTAGLACGAMIGLIALMGQQISEPFIYFQF